MFIIHPPVFPTVLRRQTSTDDSSTADKPVSDFTKTGIPVIISLTLFFLVFCVLFYIVRKKRIQNKREEEANDRRRRLEHVNKDGIDDDFELGINDGRHGGIKEPTKVVVRPHKDEQEWSHDDY